MASLGVKLHLPVVTLKIRPPHPSISPGRQTATNAIKGNMSQLVTLTAADIKARVLETNSFSKLEMVSFRAQITDARREKRANLATLGGAEVGALVAKLSKERGAVITEMKSHLGVKSQTWTIRLTAKVHKSEADRLRAEAARLMKALNKVEAKLEEATTTATV